MARCQPWYLKGTDGPHQYFDGPAQLIKLKHGERTVPALLMSNGLARKFNAAIRRGFGDQNYHGGHGRDQFLKFEKQKLNTQSQIEVLEPRLTALKGRLVCAKREHLYEIFDELSELSLKINKAKDSLAEASEKEKTNPARFERVPRTMDRNVPFPKKTVALAGVHQVATTKTGGNIEDARALLDEYAATLSYFREHHEAVTKQHFENRAQWTKNNYKNNYAPAEIEARRAFTMAYEDKLRDIVIGKEHAAKFWYETLKRAEQLGLEDLPQIQAGNSRDKSKPCFQPGANGQAVVVNTADQDSLLQEFIEISKSFLQSTNQGSTLTSTSIRKSMKYGDSVFVYSSSSEESETDGELSHVYRALEQGYERPGGQMGEEPFPETTREGTDAAEDREITPMSSEKKSQVDDNYFHIPESSEEGFESRDDQNHTPGSSEEEMALVVTRQQPPINSSSEDQTNLNHGDQTPTAEDTPVERPRRTPGTRSRNTQGSEDGQPAPKPMDAGGASNDVPNNPIVQGGNPSVEPSVEPRADRGVH
ncbi:hypothetical protein BU23DRAFT_565606 [Bimuria novae-zelandiae CBS 107.79]|uniref:Uncharacterized protein n=1 Tax=Bimuria novae-zelandiae CBS 107.79 TaxID=1447943 RepID=A0A6A5VJX8_9PLEO|nr:hypothetical protein BU23DRAFT_565606 [Bimuria novae-zelandiae CBS 107.79]